MGENEQRTDAASEQAETSNRSRTMHIVRQVVIVLVLALVVGGLYLYWPYFERSPQAAQSQAPREPMPVGTITVRAQDIPLTSRYLAQTRASQIVPIRARVSGFLIERAFEEGQPVESGQVLFRIDPQPFEVALAQAEAQLAAAQARLERATKQLARFEELSQLQSAAANELEQWQEEQQVATAEVRQQEATVEQSRLDLNYTTIRAPLDGVIGEAQQDVGSYISATGSSAELAVVWQVDPIYVRFDVSEQDLLRWQRMVGKGEVTDLPVEDFEVRVVLPDGRVHPEIGRINYVDVTLDPSTGTAAVRATVPNSGGQLRPGQFVHADISGATRLGVILVPQSAVMQSPAGANVYVVDDNGAAQTRRVQLGEWNGDDWIIDSGLAPGDRVIVDHLMQLRPGTPVQPKPALTPTTTEASS